VRQGLAEVLLGLFVAAGLVGDGAEMIPRSDEVGRQLDRAFQCRMAPSTSAY
jgi:hypothetical protein